MTDDAVNQNQANGEELPEWKPHFYRTGPYLGEYENNPAEDASKLRTNIEPWLSAVFQSEHLSLLLGSGISISMASLLDAEAAEMKRCDFSEDYKEMIEKASEESAALCGRGEPNFEDDIRIATQLLQGLEIMNDERAAKLREDINNNLKDFLSDILEFE